MAIATDGQASLHRKSAAAFSALSASSGATLSDSPFHGLGFDEIESTGGSGPAAATAVPVELSVTRPVPFAASERLLAVALALGRSADLVGTGAAPSGELRVSQRFTSGQAASAAAAIAKVLSAHSVAESNAAAAEASVRQLGVVARTFGIVEAATAKFVADSIKAGGVAVAGGEVNPADVVVVRKAGACARLLAEAIGSPVAVEAATGLVESLVDPLLQLAWHAGGQPLAPEPSGIYAACALLRVASKGGPVR